jgi:hypothetical protein
LKEMRCEPSASIACKDKRSRSGSGRGGKCNRE